MQFQKTIGKYRDYLIGSLCQKTNIVSYDDHHIYTSCLGRNSLVIDLGAYDGEFSSKVSSAFECKCLAVEALPSSYDKIIESKLIKKFNYVICKNNGPVNLYVSNQPTTTSIMKKICEMHGTKENITAEGINFEKFLEINGVEDVDILKADIEGAEMEMFASVSDKTILKAKQITIEFHTFIDRTMRGGVEAVKKRLKRLGFFYLTFPVSWSNENDCDVLFINKNKIKLTFKEKIYIFILKYILLRFNCIRKNAYQHRQNSCLPD